MKFVRKDLVTRRVLRIGAFGVTLLACGGAVVLALRSVGREGQREALLSQLVLPAQEAIKERYQVKAQANLLQWSARAASADNKDQLSAVLPAWIRTPLAASVWSDADVDRLASLLRGVPFIDPGQESKPTLSLDQLDTQRAVAMQISIDTIVTDGFSEQQATIVHDALMALAEDPEPGRRHLFVTMVAQSGLMYRPIWHAKVQMVADRWPNSPAGRSARHWITQFDRAVNR